MSASSRRFHEMMKLGFLDEVAALRARGDLTTRSSSDSRGGLPAALGLF